MTTYNILLLCDNKIREDQLADVKKEVGTIYKNNTNTSIKWHEEWRDFSSYPKEVYFRELEGLSRSYISQVTKEINSRWHEEIDCVVFLIHRDNWNLSGVWGWNHSTTFSGYGVQQVRFDNRNIVNSIGTLYHEMMHDLDTFVFTYTGKHIAPMVKVNNWDNFAVHGGRDTNEEGKDGWKYIRYNENQHALRTIAPAFNEALSKRRDIFTKRIGLMQEIIRLAEQVIILQRALIAKRRGELPILIKNKCSHLLNLRK
jgi:hypothetical protein